MPTTLKGTIWGGVVFSASPATINIPTGRIDLEIDQQQTITIPIGIKVVLATVNILITDDSHHATLGIRNESSNKLWVRAVTMDGDTKESEKYIGVTAGKQYALYVNSTNVYDGNAYLKYSPSINNVTPDITDY